MVASPPEPGIYVPVPTFFAGRASAAYDAVASPLDPDAQAAHAVYLARSGIRGLVVLGTTGEAVHVSDAERAALLSGLRAALDAAGFPAPGFPLIAGTAAQCVADVVAQLEVAARAGCQYGLCLVPGYNAPVMTQEGIVAWFTAVADRSPIPVMVYHYPGVANMVKVTPQTHAALARHPNIVGCKLSHADLSHHLQVALDPDVAAAPSSSYRVFTGLGQHLTAAMAVGVAGAIDGAAGFFPRCMVRLFSLVSKSDGEKDGQEERARLQLAMSRVDEMIVRFGTVAIKEATARLRGFGDRDGTRLPLVGGLPGGEEEWARWKGVMDAAEELEKGLGGSV